MDDVTARYAPRVVLREVGTVVSVGEGIARVRGLPSVQSEELLAFRGGVRGMAFNLDPSEVGVILLDESTRVEAGEEVHRTGRVLDVPVGEGLLGRVVDPLGRPRDETGAFHADARWPIEREAPPIMHRAPVRTPLQTGLKAVDALLPIGRGQRELIVGDRQTGKTAVALDTIINQRDTDVVAIYCAIGQQNAAVAGVVDRLRRSGAMATTTVIAAEAESAPGLQFVAPYAAMTLAEHLMEQGRDVLVVFDDMTQHAQAYREISLLLRRPPGREAYPGDVFYIHSRLLERATHLREAYGGGSVTALPIVETEAQDISGYIPTNLISITDGQIYLSPDLGRRGVWPAVDIGLSVSRVGGKTQLPGLRSVAGELKLGYAQFEELETFARFGTRLDEETRRALEHGRRIREVLKQPQYDPRTVCEQVAVLVAADAGLFDEVDLEAVIEAADAVRRRVPGELPVICEAIRDGQKLSVEQRESIEEAARRVVAEARGRR
jgi:F-type H+-transporting ATPase subunit alpha